MQYYSLHDKANKEGFEQDPVEGLAPDGGLYFPESITPLPRSFFEQIEQYSYPEMAWHAIQQFVGDAIPEKNLRQILEETLQFEFPLVPIT